MKRHYNGLKIAVVLIFAANFMVANAEDIDPKLMKGWEAGSEYNRHYDVREFEKIRAYFIRAKEVVPMPGMSPATVVEVLEGADLIEVHLCPTWYRKPSEIMLKKNERIKIKGVWAEINGKDIFMASKIPNSLPGKCCQMKKKKREWQRGKSPHQRRNLNKK
jgi:hypothetical protein